MCFVPHRIKVYGRAQKLGRAPHAHAHARKDGPTHTQRPRDLIQVQAVIERRTEATDQTKHDGAAETEPVPGGVVVRTPRARDAPLRK